MSTFFINNIRTASHRAVGIVFVCMALFCGSCSNPGDLGDPIITEPPKPFSITLNAADISLTDDDDNAPGDSFNYILADASTYYPLGTDTASITLDTSSRVPMITKLRLAFVPNVRSVQEAALASTQRIILALDSFPVTGSGAVFLNNGQIQCRVRTEDNPIKIETITLRQSNPPPYRKDESFALIECSKFTARNVIRTEIQMQLVYQRKVRIGSNERKVDVRTRVAGVFLISYEPKK